MEGREKRVAKEGTEEEDVEAEVRAETERAEREAEEKEGLVQRLEANKYCGGIFLKNFPEGSCDKKVEKQEALLTVITACSLTEQEKERLEEAEVAVTRSGRKGKVDLKIKLVHADGLMRKVWGQLEKPCREEGVKRFQIEASSQVTPPRIKRLTGFQRARAKVAEIITKEAEEKANKGNLENGSTVEEAQMKLASPEKEASDQTEIPKETREVQNKLEENINQLQEGKVLVNEPGMQEVKETIKDTDNTSERSQGMKPEPAGNISAKGEPIIGEGDTVRVKKQKWMPEAGFRRCGLKCPGCAEKCAEQGIEDCQNCHLNKTKKKNNNPCANRGECTDPKPAMMVKPKAQGRKNNQLDASVKVGSQVVEYVQDHVEVLVKKIENNGDEEEEDEIQGGEKRSREPGSTPEEHKRSIKKSMNKFGGGSKIALATKMPNLTM